MRYAVSVPNFRPADLVVADGSVSHLSTLVDWALAAEAAGWDGFFLWDHLLFWKTWRLLIDDPWLVLAAIAARTQRIRLGPMVTPLPRRRPWKLARECVSLDHLSGGRLILGVGQGAPVEADYLPFGEPGEPTTLASVLDEGLQVLDGLWRGEPFTFHGQHYHLDDVTFLPRPLQSPRPPIWIGGTWPKPGPMRRAARWDGVFPLKFSGPNEFSPLLPDDVRALRAFIAEHRPSTAGPFDVVVAGSTPGHDPTRMSEIVGPYIEAGITWWVEGLDWFTYQRPEAIAERIAQGPPGR